MYDVCIGVSEQALGWFPTFGDNKCACMVIFSCVLFVATVGLVGEWF